MTVSTPEPTPEILVRDGFCVVGVTAQRFGIEADELGLAAQDPVRYGNLRHPGDDYWFDIFCQAAVEALVATGVILPDDGDTVLVAARNEWP